MRSFEAAGLWYVPGNEERRIAGTLTFSQADGIRLRVTGAELLASTPGTGTVYGVVSDSPYGRFVTLNDCFWTDLKLGLPGLTTQEIFSNYAYIASGHVPADASFSRLEIESPQIGEWFPGAGLVPNGTQGLVLEYRQPPSLTSTVRGTSVELGARLSQDWRDRSVTLTERIILSVWDDVDQSLDQVRRLWLSPVQNLFSFIADEPISIETLRLFSQHHPSNGDRGRLPITLLFQPIGQRSHRSRGRVRMLFRASDVSVDFQRLVEGWFALTEESQAFCDAYFALQYDPPGFLEARFLGLLRAITLLDQAFDPERDSIERALSRVIDRLSGFAPSERALSMTRSEFGRQVVDTWASVMRGRLPLNRREQRLQLHALIERVGFLTRIFIMRAIGLTEAEILGFLERHGRYADLLRG